MIKGLLFFTTILLSTSVLSEYRAYQYMVKSNDPYAVATKAQSQFIVSTLNPSAYKSYHGGQFVSVDLLRTWICPGYTGKGQKTCDHPYDKEIPLQ